MYQFEPKKISKKEFLTLDEKDIMFITNPGRMGDEDGSTFIVRSGNKFTIYRVDGWMYSNEEGKEIEKISMEDTIRQFPKWYEVLKHRNNRNYKGKYQHLYMGFGNGLSVDNSIYNEYEPYLQKLIEECLVDSTDEEKEGLKYAVIFNVWEKAFINMVNDKKYILK